MSPGPGDLFRLLEPPPGGLPALRARMRRRRAPRLAAVLAVAGLVAAGLAVRPDRLGSQGASPDPAQMPDVLVRGAAGVLEVPTHRRDVRLFWVTSLTQVDVGRPGGAEVEPRPRGAPPEPDADPGEGAEDP
jgi:hypothetical protein